MDALQAQESHSTTRLPSPSMPDLTYLRGHECHLVWWWCCFIVINLAFVYLTTWISFALNRKSEDRVKVPPTLPYVIPYLGHALSLLIEPARALAGASQQFAPRTIHGLKVAGWNVYFVYGPENVARLRKYPSTITTPGVTTFVLKTLFGMSPKAVDMYSNDDSGIYSNPQPGSHVAPHNRIDHLTHANFHKHLLGTGLQGIYERFAVSFLQRLPVLGDRNEWSYFPDLLDYWLPSMTSAMNEALAGPIIECVNPDFTSELLEYYPYMHNLMKRVPGWWMLKARRLRKKLIHDIKIWHSIARARFQESDVDRCTAGDPWWGSAFMRGRQKILAGVENWDADAIASSDFGIFWGASVNIHPMAVWAIIELFRDKPLLERVRAELSIIHFREISMKEDIEKLLAVPLLQSIYSELLRLRVEVQTIFSSHREDIYINNWRIPRNSLVVVPAGAAHRDPDVWNSQDGEHPLDQFYADRFLVYPGVPQSGPRKTARAAGDSAVTSKAMPDDGKPRFVNSGLSDSFMPYGIGERTCPGRGFARREIIALCALIADRYDIEFVDKNQDFGMTTAFYGIGTQRPRSKIPFKIRKRSKSWQS